jgi:uncharacterized protein
MNKMLTILAAAAALGLTASPTLAEKAAKLPGSLTVYDDAKMFDPAGIEKAKQTLSNARFDHGLKVTVDRYAEVPADKMAQAVAAQSDRNKWHQFLESWAKERAAGDKAKGIYILVVRKPVGGVAVISDRQTSDRGFTNADADRVRETLIAAFREANKEDSVEKKQEVRSGGLTAAMDEIVSDLRDTTVATGATHSTRNDARGGGMSVGGWVCLGLFVLLGVWLVIGLIRAFSGGGGMGGMGGGGFGSSLLGGLFGAMAGMWLYNSFFGGGGMFGGGSDAYAGDAGASDADTGAGDWEGGSASAGGYDDAGGGGGDWGGGGDFGGGDFGGDF